MEIRLQMVALEGKKSWLIHRTANDLDTYWTSPAGLLRFDSAGQAESFVRAKGREVLADRLPFLELDVMARFTEHPRACVCPDAFYNSWNFFGDLAATLGESFSGYSEEGICVHEELFWSSSLTGQTSTPRLSPSDLRILRQVIEEGMGRLRAVWEPSVGIPA